MMLIVRIPFWVLAIVLAVRLTLRVMRMGVRVTWRLAKGLAVVGVRSARRVRGAIG